MALMKGTIVSCSVKFACCAVTPAAGRVSTTVRFPPTTLVRTTCRRTRKRLVCQMHAEQKGESLGNGGLCN